MGLNVTTENPGKEARRFLRHWTIPTFVEEQLEVQHQGLSREKCRTKARQISRSVHQGLELLSNADVSPPATKPLALFYSVENLFKAACICRDRDLVSEGLRSHGLGGEREIRRNSIKNLACHIRAPGKDVWSHVFHAFNSDRFQLPIQYAKKGRGLQDQVNRHGTPPLQPPAQLQFGELLRHLPEFGDDLEFASWGSSFMVKAEGLVFRIRPGPPEKREASFTLRHGHRPGLKQLIESREGNLLRGYSQVEHAFDTVKFQRSSAKSGFWFPDLRVDVFQNHYCDLSMVRRRLGELPAYLGALFVLSDVVRYQAEHWLRLLDDRPGEGLLVEHFLDIASRKVPNLVLNELHQQLFIFEPG